jgi:probable ATP-dependent RNA helicase DDX4
MGFERDMRAIIEERDMPPKENRLTLMFSATFPRPIQELARSFLKLDNIFLEVGRVGGACSDVEQEFLEADGPRSKDRELLRILQEGGRRRVLVFVSTKRTADKLDDFLHGRGLPTTSIHGDRMQAEREKGACLIDAAYKQRCSTSRPVARQYWWRRMWRRVGWIFQRCTM